jgi:Kef-type K+ transport system membrane component KefB
MTQEVWTFTVIAALVIVPRLLLRWGIPAPLSAFGLGLLTLWIDYTFTGAHWSLLATLGITSLFLHAGMEVNVQEWVEEKNRLIWHIGLKMLVLLGVAGTVMYLYQIDRSLAVLIALAIVTPSTGFILNTLGRLQLNEREQFWVRNKAIASEVVALAIMFVALQTSDTAVDSGDVALRALALIGLMLALPVVFGFFGRVITPHAAGSEFSMLVMMGLVAGYITKSLGVYYLVGAFLVGLVAVLLKPRLPSMANAHNLEAVHLFATFFIPFYFFVAGTRVPAEALSTSAMAAGVVLLAIVMPVRWLVVWLQRRWLHEESNVSSVRVTIALTPTLIFTLVIAEILRARGDIDPEVFGSLLTYAVLNTVLPTLLFALLGLKQPHLEKAT